MNYLITHHLSTPVQQEKRLIPHQEYLDYKLAKAILEDKEADSALKKEAKEKVNAFPDLFFTDESPLHQAMSTGHLEYKSYTGELYLYKVSFTPLN